MFRDPGAITDAVIVTDAQGRVTFWNETAEALYGWKQAEVLGRSIMDVTPAPEALEKAAEIVTRLKAGESWTGTFRVRHKDWHWFEVHVTDIPVPGADGDSRGILSRF